MSLPRPAPDRRVRVPRKPSEKSLQNVALFYLRRHSPSVAQLRAVLTRRVKRAERSWGMAFELGPAIERLIERFVAAGYLDDRRLAVSKTASLRRQGRSTRRIRLTLRQKGLAAPLVNELVRSDAEVEREAAWALARRKRLGPYRRTTQPEDRRRELGVLVRAGFSFGLAKEIVSAAQPRD